MLGARLHLAAAEGLLAAPLLVIGARGGDDLSALPSPHLIVQGDRADHDALAARGHAVAVAPDGRFAAALVCLPRSKALARDRIARAAALTDGPILVDGQKTDGVDSVLKACAGIGRVGSVIAKAHGKLFVLEDADAASWRAEPALNPQGFLVPPGGFSADGIDPGSALLAQVLPAGLSGRVVDLGAGWGYLAAEILNRPGVARCDLVEADHAALDCARVNVRDPRAAFHWADATRFRADPPADHVVTNPPFHRGRAADPGLGQAFVAAAAALLAPRGQVWLVANRHLPYEAALRERFAECEELEGSPAFKIYRAARPRRTPARGRRQGGARTP